MTVLPARLSPTTGNYGPTIEDADYADRINANLEWLAGLAVETLSSVAGTNTITASCGTPPLTAYSRKLYMIKPANANTGAVFLNIDLVGSKPWKTQAGAAFVGGELDPASQYLAYDAGAEFRMVFTVPTGALSALALNYLTGFLTGTNPADAANDIDILAGICRDSTDAVDIISTTMTKRFDAAWVLGHANGGMLQSANLAGTIVVTSGAATVVGTGTAFTTDYTVGSVFQTAGGQARRVITISSNIAMTVESNWGTTETGVTYKRGGKAKNTVYRLFAIYRASDGYIDYAAHPLDTPTDLPAGYTKWRRIWYFLTDSAGANRPYVQVGDQCILSTPIADYSASLSASVSTTITSAAPPGVLAMFELVGSLSAYGSTGKIWVRAMTRTAQSGVPDLSIFTFLTAALDPVPCGDFVNSASVRLSSASQYAMDYLKGGTFYNFNIDVHLAGWTDSRGRL
jgi:hypothetical protein